MTQALSFTTTIFVPVLVNASLSADGSDVNILSVLDERGHEVELNEENYSLVERSARIEAIKEACRS